MARRSRRGSSGRYNPYNAKAYKFTARRRAALKKAQAKSARERKIKFGIMAAGGAASVATVLYLGRNTSVGKGVKRDVAKQVRKFSPQHVGRAANLRRARAAVHPLRKEAVRVAGAVSPATPPGGGSYPAFITSSTGPHKPGDEPKILANGAVQGDPSTYHREALADTDANAMRTQLDNEAAWKEHFGVFEKFMDPKVRGGAERALIKGKHVSRTEMRKAIMARNRAVVKSGGQAMTTADLDKVLDAMVADGTLSGRTRGTQTPSGGAPPQAEPRNVVPNTGYTDEEHAAMFAFDTPVKPVLGVPTSKGGARGAVFIQGVSTPAPGFVSGQSSFGTKVEGTGLTPAQKGAATRARNKAKKAADAKPAAAPNKVAFSDAAPQSKPHGPSSSSITSDDWFATHKRRVIAPEAMVGKRISDWDKLLPVVQQNIENMASGWHLKINDQGIFSKGKKKK